MRISIRPCQKTMFWRQELIISTFSEVTGEANSVIAVSTTDVANDAALLFLLALFSACRLQAINLSSVIENYFSLSVSSADYIIHTI